MSSNPTITYNKISDPYKTSYKVNVLRRDLQTGIVSKELSGGFSFYWECKIGNRTGVGSTRREAVLRAIRS